MKHYVTTTKRTLARICPMQLRFVVWAKARSGGLRF